MQADWMKVCMNCNKAYASRNLERLKSGQPWECLNTYVQPMISQAKLNEVEENMKAGRSCFRIVTGAHGQGKSVMLEYIKRQLALTSDVCFCGILLDPDWIRSESKFTNVIISKIFSTFTFPDGETLEHKLLNKADFRIFLAGILYDEVEGLNIELRIIWKDLTNALWKACSDDVKIRAIAINWLKGEDLSKEDRAILGVSKKNIRSSNPTPIENALRFYTVLSKKLGRAGFLVTFDEIEQLAYSGPKTGRALLSRLRDIVNLQSVVLKGDCHVFYSISDWYLAYSGLMETPEVAGLRISVRKPKITLRDVERFDRIIQDEIILKTDLSDKEIQEILGKMKMCFKAANPGADVDLAEEVLLLEARRRADQNIPSKILLEAYGLIKESTEET